MARPSHQRRARSFVGAEKRLRLVAADIVQHFENRVAALDGKAMVVCMSRRICAALYNEIITLRPEWHSPDDTAGVVKIVMTGSGQPSAGTAAAHRQQDPARSALKTRPRSRRRAQAGDRARHVAEWF